MLLLLSSTTCSRISTSTAGGRARPPPNYSLLFPNKFNKKTTLIPSCAPFSSRRKSNGNRRERQDPDPETPPKLLVVQPRLRPQYLLRSKLNEALSLANSLQEQRRDNLLDSNKKMKMKMMPPHLLVQNPEEAHRSVRADMYFGSGTVADVKRYLRALKSDSDSQPQGEGGGLDAVFVNTILSGIQQRNLEMEWGKPVLDRVGLIIEIFHAHAHTKEAMLQSELAALMYKRSRLVRVRGPGGRLTFGTGGEAQVVSARGRGSGGRGFISGAGETELQLQRQRIQDRRTHLLSQVEEVRRTRFVQRSARKRHGGSHGQALATVAIVGYTNAGKSTLVSALSESDLYSDDRLFATVDPILRSVILPSGRKVLFSDTVGFISDLPVQLVEAFHATLEEVAEADLLVHVLDASAPDLDEQRATVLEVLQQIGVAEEKIQNMVEVWNKIDLLNKHIGVDETIEEDDFLSGDEGNDGTVAAEEYVSGVEEGEDEIYSEEECPSGGEVKEIETISRMECLSGDEEDGGFTSDQDKYGKASEEAIEGFQDRHAVSLEQQETNLNIAREARAIEHVETSAVMGIGLQELLNVIDEKLSAQKSVVTKHFGPFDRKWRPSYTADTEKAA